MSDKAGQQGSEFTAVAVAVFGSICVGSVPFLVRLLQTTGQDTLSILFWRYLIGLGLLVPLAVLLGHKVTPAARPAALGLLLLGAFSAGQSFCYYKAIEKIPTSIAVTIFFAYPIVLLGIERVVVKMRAPLSTVAAVALIFLGVALMSLPRAGEFSASALDWALIISTPLLYAVYISASHGFTRRLPTLAAATMLYLGQVLALAPVVAAVGLAVPATAHDWLIQLAIASLGGALYIAGFAYALPRLSSAGYSVIMALELVTGVGLAVLALGEPLLALQAAGVLLVLAGVILDRLMRARRIAARRE